MASELAKQITEAILQKSWLTNTAEAVDTKLWEVWSVLDGLRTSKRTQCWCAVLPNGEVSIHNATGEHDSRCERARDLMERLRVPEVR